MSATALRGDRAMRPGAATGQEVSLQTGNNALLKRTESANA
jgi:hypothetical protein